MSTAVLGLAAVSYNVAGAVAASGISETTIRTAIKAGDLIVHWLGSKPVIRSIDLDEWIQTFPTEKESA